ncbi:hypothetical protein MAM1_0250c08724 [Mucor ambiguus]|uniref:Uncharacterized protein n=1 Tax=Mucor ambiguus TaxID=91626 RepID=A0A0C9MZW6_9FUNG|nr:hypothetical protein MAM1_0250c08724 [Mucor ambiguus]
MISYFNLCCSNRIYTTIQQQDLSQVGTKGKDKIQASSIPKAAQSTNAREKHLRSAISTSSYADFQAQASAYVSPDEAVVVGSGMMLVCTVKRIGCNKKREREEGQLKQQQWYNAP